MPLAGRVPSFRPRFPPGFLFSMKSGMEKAKMSPNTLCFPKKKKRKKEKKDSSAYIDRQYIGPPHLTRADLSCIFPHIHLKALLPRPLKPQVLGNLLW